MEKETLHFDLASMTTAERAEFIHCLSKVRSSLKRQGHRVTATRKIPPPTPDNKIFIRLHPAR